MCLANLALTHPTESCRERQICKRRSWLKQSVPVSFATYHSKSTVHEEHEVRAGQQEGHIELLEWTNNARWRPAGQVPNEVLGVVRIKSGECGHAERREMPCAKSTQRSTVRMPSNQLKAQGQCQKLPPSRDQRLQLNEAFAVLYIVDYRTHTHA